MAAEVAAPSLNLDGSSPLRSGSRRSILASMKKSRPISSQSRSGETELNGDEDQGNTTTDANGLSKSDSVLRTRRGSTNSKTGSAQGMTGSQRASTHPSSAGAASPTSPGTAHQETAIAPAVAQEFPAASPETTDRLAVPESSSEYPSGNNGSIGSRLRRRLSNLSQQNTNKSDDQADRASIHSNFSSHREAISSFIRRSRSRSGSQEPPESSGRTPSLNGDTNGTFSRRRASSAARRMSMKLPGKLGRKRRDSNASNQDESEDVPPVPSIPAEKRGSIVSSGSRRSGSKKSAPVGYPGSSQDEKPSSAAESKQLDDDSNGSAQPQPASKTNGHAKPAAKERKDKEEEAPASSAGSAKETEEASDSYLGAATAAIAGAGAAVGGTAVAVVNKVTGRAAQDDGYNSESDESDDDVFHDAELANISEGEEEEEEQESRSRSHQRKVSTGSHKKSNGRAAAAEESRSAYHTAGRSRGVSEASGTDSVQASSGALAIQRTESPESGNGTAPKTPSKLKGTSGAKRRAGSTPIAAEEDGTSTTPQDAKAKKELPAEVREKAARVQQLTFDDVQQSSEEMYEDIKVARGALHLFLNSRMIEAEEIIKEHADRRMYYALGYCLIATMKGFMTFESEDLAIAISYCKDAMHIAHLLRKPSNSVANFGRFVRGTGHTPSGMAAMSIVQRHAELVYAESMLLKAVLGIVYSGDFFGFVAEALNMRNAYGIYRSLGKFVEHADSKAPNKFDKGIDQDFRSGAFLGNGLISLILGLLPSKVLKIMDVFGYSGDTKEGLNILMKAGGWSETSKKTKPKMSQEDEGIRRPVCDMGILLFHLVISVFIPVTGVNIAFADQVLHYHLQRYPQGVFFLYFSGRLYSTQAMCERAIKQYKAAREAQQEYVQLQHISWWDASLCHMSLTQWDKAQECFEVLLRESNWSKCVYTYGVASNMFSASNGDDEKAADLFAKVPGLMQRIAGKSIPMEKFVARKAHKFNTQGRLLLPALEFSYIYHCLSNAPRYALLDEQLVMVSDALSALEEVSDPSQYHSGADEYWDDFCLAHFLRGVSLRYIAHPEPHAKVDPEESDIPEEEANEQAELSFKTVLEHGHKISTDHYIIYFSHYELGRLYGNTARKSDAKRELELVLSGKMLEDKGQRKGNHKYGMQNMALLRSNGALNALNL
ncbi:unnamed protein product [Sympodiomycopsis kandeliae]